MIGRTASFNPTPLSTAGLLLRRGAKVTVFVLRRSGDNVTTRESATDRPRGLMLTASPKALAVRSVSENQSKHRPGLDGNVWDTPEKKRRRYTPCGNMASLWAIAPREQARPPNRRAPGSPGSGSSAVKDPKVQLTQACRIGNRGHRRDLASPDQKIEGSVQVPM